jgi:hypothetical protein
MRLWILAVLALPSLADARPFTAGVGIGRTQAKADAQGDANDTAELFARLGFTRRLAGQLELAKIGDDIRTGTALLVVELGSHPHFVPTLSAGVGFDHSPYTKGSHMEGGFGLEYRSGGGFVIGGEFRLGGRSIDTPIYYATDDAGTIAFQEPYAVLQDGEYRTARVFAAIRF